MFKKILIATTILCLSVSSAYAGKSLVEQVRVDNPVIAQMQDQIGDTVVMVTNEAGTAGGSGVVIGEANGYYIILTAAHVVDGAPVVSGVFTQVSSDGGLNRVPGVIVANAPNIDLALVIVPSDNLPNVEVAELANLDEQPVPFEPIWGMGAGFLLPPFPTTGLFGVGDYHVDFPGFNFVVDISSIPAIGGDSGGGVFTLNDEGNYVLFGIIQASSSNTETWSVTTEVIWDFINDNNMGRYVNS